MNNMDNLIKGILIEIDVIFDNLEDMMSEEAAKDYQFKYDQLKLYLLDQQKEIEKQQKEIECLKRLKGFIRIDNNNKMELLKLKDFISKDVIKAKIKQLEKELDITADLFVGSVKYCQIKLLKELLGEEDE